METTQTSISAGVRKAVWDLQPQDRIISSVPSKSEELQALILDRYCWLLQSCWPFLQLPAEPCWDAAFFSHGHLQPLFSFSEKQLKLFENVFTHKTVHPCLVWTVALNNCILSLIKGKISVYLFFHNSLMPRGEHPLQPSAIFVLREGSCGHKPGKSISNYSFAWAFIIFVNVTFVWWALKKRWHNSKSIVRLHYVLWGFKNLFCYIFCMYILEFLYISSLCALLFMFIDCLRETFSSNGNWKY